MRTSGRALRGTLLFHLRGGGARLLNDSDELLAWVPEGETGCAMHGDTVEAQPLARGSGFRKGSQARVTRVLERARDTVVGAYQRAKGFTCVIPDDPRYPQTIVVRTGGPSLARPPRSGDKVVVKLEPWTNANVSPAGQIVELLGSPTEPGVDMLSVIRAYDLRTEFPEAVVRQAESCGGRVTEEDTRGRLDCRGQFVLTIDPDDAKDHDDAIYVEKRRDGWSASIHIADVAHYVKPGTALDREARRRGNSTYLADRCIPMLPEALSADLCSLRAGVDRLAHSVFIEFTTGGKVKRVRFGKSVINVHSRLTYRQAMAMLRGETVAGFVPAVGEHVRKAWELAAMLRRNRFAAGSLDLEFPEVKLWLDAKGQVERIERVDSDESHQLIEEFMLAANEAVAREIKNRPAPCIYRIHEKPDPDRLEEFRQLAATHGVRVGDLSERKEVQRMLGLLRGRPDEQRLKIEFLKSLRRAEYSPDPLGHYGLAKADYLHFTSPIRRYADLVAHRVLARERVGGRKELGDAAAHISATERNSASAEMDSKLLKKLEFFQRQLAERKPDEYRSTVTDVRPHGLLVEVPDADTTGLVHVSMLPGGPWQFDGPRARLVNKRSQKVWKVGDALMVYVCRVDVGRRSVDFAAV